MMKKVLLFILVISLLWGGLFISSQMTWKNQEESNIKPKQAFYIQTKKISDFHSDYFLEKTSKIDADSEVKLISEVYGKLDSLEVKEGQKVTKWQKLASFVDTTGLITIAYKQAQVNLSQSKNALDSNKISLDKAVFDAELNLEKLKLNFSTLQKNVEENLKQAKNSFKNATLNDKSSKSNLNLQKLDETIKKLEYDYEIKKLSNQENLKSFLNTLHREVDNLKDLTEDTTDFWDSLFFVTSKYNKTSSFDDYFGAEDSLQRDNSKKLLKDLLSFKFNNLKDLKITNLKEIDTYASVIEEWYRLNTEFLQEAEKTIKNSIPSLWTLSQLELDWYSQGINGFQAQNQRLASAFIALKNQINLFLNTYKQNEESIVKQIELTKRDKEIMKISLQSGALNSEVNYNKILINSNDSLENMRIAIKNAENLLQTAKKNRQVSLNTLQNNIRQAEITLEKANIDYAKLHVISPINGIVSSLKAEVWQIYPTWTTLLTIVTDTKSELNVYLTADELEKVQIWDEVAIDYRGKSFTGNIFSKSNLADRNLNYKVTISLGEKINLIGGIAKLRFHLYSEKKLIPINALEILAGESRTGKIQVFSGSHITSEIIQLWKTFGNEIEFITDLKAESKVILSDVSNFESEKFELVEKIKKD